MPRFRRIVCELSFVPDKSVPNMLRHFERDAVAPDLLSRPQCAHNNTFRNQSARVTGVRRGFEHSLIVVKKVAYYFALLCGHVRNALGNVVLHLASFPELCPRHFRYQMRCESEQREAAANQEHNHGN